MDAVLESGDIGIERLVLSGKPLRDPDPSDL
jgi:hypothetical protein